MCETIETFNTLPEGHNFPISYFLKTKCVQKSVKWYLPFEIKSIAKIQQLLNTSNTLPNLSESFNSKPFKMVHPDVSSRRKR